MKTNLKIVDGIIEFEGKKLKLKDFIRYLKKHNKEYDCELNKNLFFIKPKKAIEWYYHIKIDDYIKNVYPSFYVGLVELNDEQKLNKKVDLKKSETNSKVNTLENDIISLGTFAVGTSVIILLVTAIFAFSNKISYYWMSASLLGSVPYIPAIIKNKRKHTLKENTSDLVITPEVKEKTIENEFEKINKKIEKLESVRIKKAFFEVIKEVLEEYNKDLDEDKCFKKFKIIEDEIDNLIQVDFYEKKRSKDVYNNYDTKYNTLSLNKKY